jgi:hypothetical protein
MSSKFRELFNGPSPSPIHPIRGDPSLLHSLCPNPILRKRRGQPLDRPLGRPRVQPEQEGLRRQEEE